MRVHYKTFGCKANQYDTERMRQAGRVGRRPGRCARRRWRIRRPLRGQHLYGDQPGRRGGAAVHTQGRAGQQPVCGSWWRAAPPSCARSRVPRDEAEVAGVVEGHDPGAGAADERAAAMKKVRGLTQLGSTAPLDRTHAETVAATVLRRRAGRHAGLAQGAGRMRPQVRLLRDPARAGTEPQPRARTRSSPRRERSGAHVIPELVITGVHIGHYGRDLERRAVTLTALVRRLLDEVAGTAEAAAPRFRLGSIEATEIDDGMLRTPGRVGGTARAAPAHAAAERGGSGAARDAALAHPGAVPAPGPRDRRRASPRSGSARTSSPASPGESPADHARHRWRWCDELPFTYLHVFPYLAPRRHGRGGRVSAIHVPATGLRANAGGSSGRSPSEKARSGTRAAAAGDDGRRWCMEGIGRHGADGRLPAGGRRGGPRAGPDPDRLHRGKALGRGDPASSVDGARAVDAVSQARAELGSPWRTRPNRRAYVETYGCQMNIADGELMEGILGAGRDTTSRPRPTRPT